MLFRKRSLDARDPRIENQSLLVFPVDTVTLKPRALGYIITDIEIYVPDKVFAYIDFQFGRESLLPGVFPDFTNTLRSGTLKLNFSVINSLPYTVILSATNPVVVCTSLYTANVQPQEVHKFPTDFNVFNTVRASLEGFIGGSRD